MEIYSVYLLWQLQKEPKIKQEKVKVYPRPYAEISTLSISVRNLMVFFFFFSFYPRSHFSSQKWHIWCKLRGPIFPLDFS